MFYETLHLAHWCTGSGPWAALFDTPDLKKTHHLTHAPSHALSSPLSFSVSPKQSNYTMKTSHYFHPGSHSDLDKHTNKTSNEHQKPSLTGMFFLPGGGVGNRGSAAWLWGSVVGRGLKWGRAGSRGERQDSRSCRLRLAISQRKVSRSQKSMLIWGHLGM